MSLKYKNSCAHILYSNEQYILEYIYRQKSHTHIHCHWNCIHCCILAFLSSMTYLRTYDLVSYKTSHADKMADKMDGDTLTYVTVAVLVVVVWVLYCELDGAAFVVTVIFVSSIVSEVCSREWRCLFLQARHLYMNITNKSDSNITIIRY